MSGTTQLYRRFRISATISPLNGGRGLATVDVTTDDAARLADLGTGRFLHIEKWLEADTPMLLDLLLSECKVAIDHYADNVDDS